MQEKSYNLSNYFILKFFLSNFFNGKQNLVWVFCGQTLFQALYLEIKPLKSTLGKTLKSQLLKKLSIEFYETQDLSSTHGKPKLLFYDYSCCLFFPSQSPRGTVKGQLILKCLFGVFNFFHKTNENK